MLAEIITIGDEILIGQIVDTNSAWMAKQLNLTGVFVKQITSVSDDEDHILASLAQAEERADLILITGGLGPTKDDITKKTLAKYFGMGFRRDEGALEMVTSIFKKYNRPLLDINIQQADVPDGCEVIVNKNGTAPCMWFERNGKIFVSMPGVPYEMMYLMDDEILPRIRSKFTLPFIVHKTILTANIGESFLAKEIEEIEDRLPKHIKLAYLPKLGQVRLRLSASGSDETALKMEVESYAKLMIAKIPKFVVVDEDIPFEKAVINIMNSRGLTLSTAESCTGGYIAHLITQHPGCSSVYWGGAVAYAYELKESILGVKESTLNKFGAVSEETVSEMAEGAIKQFKTDYAIAVSGIAGPDGGTADKPVGTVWIAVSNKNKTVAKVFTFSNKRIQNIERSAASAFTMLLNLLKEDGLKE
ncbi:MULTISPECIES: competence/damage-inducible protein A [unclassified Pedobacter]|jgi:nicotinamide-nucleotide amidase|uniref:competence/damage-inducible protein A n=1 Tax=Pedobacter TaxID=84567 RepID=UPI000B4C071C|nr:MULTISPECIES: competence/damage-inducible protein A [unclassified Pedobacter]MCX2430416.1 competence/damage-inducible protein A [Pedobacter sp. GR22-10]OWK70488.1 competence/damage-inducible protein A [Pedobacter sp. AJM]